MGKLRLYALGVGWWFQASCNKQNHKTFTHFAMRVKCRKTTRLQTLCGAICSSAEAVGSHLGGTVSAFIVLQLFHDIPIIDKKSKGRTAPAKKVLECVYFMAHFK